MSESRQTNVRQPKIEDWKELAEKPHDELTDAELTSKIKLSIRRRYDAPEWCLVFEFGLGNGRVADAIAVNTLPSRNFKIVGFEFKASRSDWLREKKEGSKADEFVQLCDEWYVVAGDTDIINEEEVPEGWGYLELKPNSAQLYKLVESDLTKHQSGDPDRGFWGRFFRKTVGDESNWSVDDLREAKKRGYEKARDEATEQNIDRDVERLRQKAEAYDKLKDDSPIHLPYSGDLDEARHQRLKAAEDFLEYIQGDRLVSSIEGRLDSLERSAERGFEDVIETVENMRTGLEGLREELNEVSTDE